MKYLIIGLVLLVMASCTTIHRPKPDLSTHYVTFNHPISFSFLDKKSGIILSEKTANPSKTISAKWNGEMATSKLSMRWDGDMLIVKTNIEEYWIPYSSISYFSRKRLDVEMIYHPKNNAEGSWTIKKAEPENAPDKK